MNDDTIIIMVVIFFLGAIAGVFIHANFSEQYVGERLAEGRISANNYDYRCVIEANANPAEAHDETKS